MRWPEIYLEKSLDCLHTGNNLKAIQHAHNQSLLYRNLVVALVFQLLVFSEKTRIALWGCPDGHNMMFISFCYERVAALLLDVHNHF